jgi:hypothetical protein
MACRAKELPPVKRLAHEEHLTLTRPDILGNTKKDVERECSHPPRVTESTLPKNSC